MKEARITKAGQALLSPLQVAERLGVSRSYVYTAAASGELRSIKLGKALRFEPRDVEAFIEAHRRGQTPAA